MKTLNKVRHAIQTLFWLMLKNDRGKGWRG